MSNSTNVEKNKNPKKLDIITILDKSKRARIFFLIALGISGLVIRLYFFPFDVPLFGDSQGYFWYAIDTSILNQFPTGHNLTNNGWPIFLSVFFQLIDSNDFLDYHNAQRLIGAIFSIATIFPVYLLCTRFFKKSYSLLGAALFIFEPRLIQNSSIGTPESMYIFLLATLLFLFLSDNFKKIYLAFLIVGLLSLVRYEGLILIIPLSVVFFIRFRTKKINIFRYLLCLAIFSMLIIPVGYMKNETMGQDGFVSHISAGPDYYQKSIEEQGSSVMDFLSTGISKTTMYFSWITIPIFVIFLPMGIFFIFTKLEFKKITLISVAIMILIPAFYAYSRDFSEVKYLFALYPLFCVISCYSLKFFIEKIKKENLILVVIISAVIITSVLYLDWKALDNEHYREAFEIVSDVKQMDVRINTDLGKYGGEFLYFHWLRIDSGENFPILKNDLPQLNIGLLEQNIIEEGKEMRERNLVYIEKMQITNIHDYIIFLKKQEITHLLIDYDNRTHDITNELRMEFKQVFDNEKEFPYLIKEYDSKENGFKYHVKLFRINYDKFSEEIN